MYDSWSERVQQCRHVAYAAEELARKANDPDARAGFASIAEQWRKIAFNVQRRRRGRRSPQMPVGGAQSIG